MTAIAAVDTALWDILGKALGVPVIQLLGGRSRDNVLVYGHANGETIDDTVKAVEAYIALGYKAVRAQSGVPACPRLWCRADRHALRTRREGTAPPSTLQHREIT